MVAHASASGFFPATTARAQPFVSAAPVTVLVTGFGPFPGAPFNPTADVVRRLARSRRPEVADVRVVTHVFRTSYAAVDAELPRLLGEHRPDAVVMLGLASRARWLRVETCARNMRSRLLPDVAGEAATSARIRLGAPPTFRGRAPFARLAALTRRAGLPVRLSHNAGRYLCNYAYWRLLEGGNEEPLPLAVFIHVPRVPRGAIPLRRSRAHAMALEDLLKAAERMVVAMGASARQARPSRFGTPRSARFLNSADRSSLRELAP